MTAVVEIGAASRRQPGMRFVQAALNGKPVAVSFPPALVRAGNVLYARDVGTFFIRVAGPGGAVPMWKTLSSGGSSSIGIVVGPPNTGAPFATFAAGIAAAVAAGIDTVMFLSGVYSEPDFTLPEGMSLQPLGADQLTTQLTASIFTNATSGVQSIAGMQLNGSIICGPSGGPATTAAVGLRDMKIIPTSAPGVVTENDGWFFMLENLEVDASDLAGTKALSFDSEVTVEATGCDFRSDFTQTPMTFGNGGTGTFTECRFRGKSIQIANTHATLHFKDAFIELPSGSSVVVQDFAGSTVTIDGEFIYGGLMVGGTIMLHPAPLSSLQVRYGTNLGTLQVGSLPPGPGIDAGVTAFATGMAAGGPSGTTAAPVYFGNGSWRRWSDDTVAV